MLVEASPTVIIEGLLISQRMLSVHRPEVAQSINLSGRSARFRIAGRIFFCVVCKCQLRSYLLLECSIRNKIFPVCQRSLNRLIRLFTGAKNRERISGQ